MGRFDKTTFIPNPDVMLDTPVGLVKLSFTTGRHVHVGTDAHNNDDMPGVTFRGKPYLVSVHFYADSDWDEGPESYRSITKRGNYRYGKDDAPPTVKLAIIAALREAVREYVKANPGVLKRAEMSAANSSIMSAQRKVKEAQADLDKANADLAEARARLMRAEVMKGEA